MLKYKIIDNFLNREDFNELNSLKLENISDNALKVYPNEINANSKIISSCIDEKLIKKLHENYHSKAFEILKDLNYEKSKLYEYSSFSIIKTGKNYKFPIHDDTPNKLLSGVIYLYPEKNTGTIFYKNKKGDDKEIVEWKQNRCLFFSRKERTTWHSYEGNNETTRVALVYNLLTTQIKKVYEIEKKSYTLGQLRWKINPYLYQYFKLYL
tara:strand:- start:905 stop:1534 length:630 start_codon:yes stop_codon:yes gene_type:complete